MRTSRTRSLRSTGRPRIPSQASGAPPHGGFEANLPFCATCDDRAPSGGDAGSCEECPRCASCGERFADRPETALLIDGWDGWCSTGCLHTDAERWSRPARAALALAVLEASADGPLSDHPERAELLGFCHCELSGVVRALLTRPRVAARAGRETGHWNASELALLAGERAGDSVVDRVCPECEATVERFVDPSGGGAGSGREEVALCDWHAHLEALRIVQRRQPARAVRPESRTDTPARRPASA